jgi:hypothetical protein
MHVFSSQPRPVIGLVRVDSQKGARNRGSEECWAGKTSRETIARLQAQRSTRRGDEQPERGRSSEGQRPSSTAPSPSRGSRGAKGHRGRRETQTSLAGRHLGDEQGGWAGMDQDWTDLAIGTISAPTTLVASKAQANMEGRGVTRPQSRNMR